MDREREIEGGSALGIALVIIPMSPWLYWLLAVVLAGLVARIAWLSVRPMWAKCAASVGAVAVLALLIVPGRLPWPN